MSEWWTYTLQDFLLFTPRAYFRLFEIYNTAIWPAQIPALLLGLGILALLRRPSPTRSRGIAAAMAACWLWVAVAFHLRRYATINWAAVYFAAAFALEALLWIWAGVLRGRLRFGPEEPVPRAIGPALLVFALALQPLAAPLLGRPWRQVELFGVAPDPTAVATLAILLLVRDRVPWGLLLIPLLWCALSGAMLHAMRSPTEWIVLAAGVTALLLSFGVSLRRRRARAAPERPWL